MGMIKMIKINESKNKNKITERRFLFRLFILRCDGRIAMTGFNNDFQQIASVEDFERQIIIERRGYRLSTTHMNTRHFIHGQPQSLLSDPVRNLLIFLLDAVFPLGIPNFVQLNEADRVLEMIDPRMGNELEI